MVVFVCGVGFFVYVGLFFILYTPLASFGKVRERLSAATHFGREQKLTLMFVLL